MAWRTYSVPAVVDNCVGEPYWHWGLGKVVTKRSDIDKALDEINDANPGANYQEVPDFDAVAYQSNDFAGIEHDGTGLVKSLTKDEWGADPNDSFGVDY